MLLLPDSTQTQGQPYLQGLVWPWQQGTNPLSIPVLPCGATKQPVQSLECPPEVGWLLLAKSPVLAEGIGFHLVRQGLDL